MVQQGSLHIEPFSDLVYLLHLGIAATTRSGTTMERVVSTCPGSVCDGIAVTICRLEGGRRME
jgi:hypothetical protein